MLASHQLVLGDGMAVNRSQLRGRKEAVASGTQTLWWLLAWFALLTGDRDGRDKVREDAGLRILLVMLGRVRCHQMLGLLCKLEVLYLKITIKVALWLKWEKACDRSPRPQQRPGTQVGKSRSSESQRSRPTERDQAGLQPHASWSWRRESHLMPLLVLPGVDVEAAKRAEEELLLHDTRCWLNGGAMPEARHPRTGASALHVAAAKGYIEVMR